MGSTDEPRKSPEPARRSSPISAPPMCESLCRKAPSWGRSNSAGWRSWSAGRRRRHHRPRRHDARGDRGRVRRRADPCCCGGDRGLRPCGRQRRAATSAAVRVPGGRRVVEIVGATLGVPVAIDNDANMAALGELSHGAGRGFSDFVLITLGTNIGMGIVAGGRVLRGAHGGAGEGGMMLSPARLVRPQDQLGRRLVEVERFGAHPSRRARRLRLGRRVGRRSGRWRGRSASVGRLRALKGGARRRRYASLPRRRPAIPTLPAIVERAIEGWAYIIANCVALFDPAAILLSGGLAGGHRSLPRTAATAGGRAEQSRAFGCQSGTRRRRRVDRRVDRRPCAAGTPSPLKEDVT